MKVMLALLTLFFLLLVLSCTEKNVCGNNICEVGNTYTENATSCSEDCISCDDNNSCTTDEFDYTTQTCTNTFLDECDCDDNNPCTKDTYNTVTHTCSYVEQKPCIGDNICTLEERTAEEWHDCPRCDDYDACTEDDYDYDAQECTHNAIPNCCGDNSCDSEEDYNSCPEDCESPLQFGNLRSRYDEVTVSGTTAIYNHEALLDTSRTKLVRNATHSILRLYIPVNFRSSVNFLKAEVQCEGGGVTLTTSGDNGFAERQKNHAAFIAFDTVLLSCTGRPCTESEEPRDSSYISRAGKEGTASLDITLLITQEETPTLDCTARVKSSNPEMTITKGFKVKSV